MIDKQVELFFDYHNEPDGNTSHGLDRFLDCMRKSWSLVNLEDHKVLIDDGLENHLLSVCDFLYDIKDSDLMLVISSANSSIKNVSEKLYEISTVFYIAINKCYDSQIIKCLHDYRDNLKTLVSCLSHCKNENWVSDERYQIRNFYFFDDSSLLVCALSTDDAIKFVTENRLVEIDKIKYPLKLDTYETRKIGKISH